MPPLHRSTLLSPSFLRIAHSPNLTRPQRATAPPIIRTPAVPLQRRAIRRSGRALSLHLIPVCRNRILGVARENISRLQSFSVLISHNLVSLMTLFPACLFSPCTGRMPPSHFSAIFSKQSHLRQNPKPNSTSIAADIFTFIPLALLLRSPSLCICILHPIIALTSCAGHCKSTDSRQDLSSSSEDKVSSALHRYQHTNPALHNALIQVASAPLTPLPRLPPDLLDCSASSSEPASRSLLFFLRLCTCYIAEPGVLLIAFFFATMFV